MKPKPSALRFFFVVARPGTGFALVALLIVAYAAYLSIVYRTGVEQVFGIALLLQLFAASTGYRERLRRGHFDPILIGGANQWRIAAAHWAMSVGLGLAVWVLLGFIELAARTGKPLTSATPAEIAAFLYVSTGAWALTLALPRYTGALLWLVLLVVLQWTQQLQAMRLTFTPVPETWGETVRSVGSVLVFPVFLVLDPAVANLSLLAGTFAGACVVWAIGAVLIGRFEGALVEDR